MRLVLAERGALEPRELAAFTDMHRRGKPLSPRQKAWFEAVADSLGVGVEEPDEPEHATVIYPSHRGRARSEIRPLVIP